MSNSTALTIHESFASNLAFSDNILWDVYLPEQFPLFEEKLLQLFRDPDPREGKVNKAMKERRKNVYNNTIAQSKYTNRNLLSTFILVTVAEGTTYTQARDATKFSVHLVIRTRKCIKEDDSTGCCMVFIDECGNVYKNWQHFVETNCLPKGVAFAPNHGVYTYSEDSELIMDAWTTPESGLGSKVLTGVDCAAGIGGLGAAAITLAAVCTAPISAPILAGATVVGLGAGAITAIRSSMQLWKRSSHEQSISITNSESRGCWLGVASGALALTSAAATRTLTGAALAGQEVSLLHESVVNGMNISTMLISGTGVANGILDLILKYSDDEDVSYIEVAQLAASLVIFTHSVYNFRLASTIISQTQDSKVNAYRKELSNRQRKMFDKMTKETVRTRGTKGKVDLIRLINEVPDKQYLNDLHKVNKRLNENKVRFSAGGDGKVVLNEDISVRPSDLRSDIQLNNGENILKGVSNPIPDSHTSISGQKTVNMLTSLAFNDNSTELLNYCGDAFKIASMLVLNPDTFQNSVRLILQRLGEKITEYLIKKAAEFIRTYRREIENFIRTTIYIDTVLFDLFNKIKDIETLTLQKLEEIITNIFVELLDYYEKMSCNDVRAKIFQCPDCNGCYRVTPI